MSLRKLSCACGAPKRLLPSRRAVYEHAFKHGHHVVMLVPCRGKIIKVQGAVMSIEDKPAGELEGEDDEA